MTSNRRHFDRSLTLLSNGRDVDVSYPCERAVGLSGACPFRVGPSNVLTVWDGQSHEARQRISSYPVSNVFASFPSPDLKWIVMGARGGSWLTHLAPGTISAPVCLQTNGSRVAESNWQVQFSIQATWLAIADGETLRVWNLKHQAPAPGSTLAAGIFSRLRFSPDERLLGAVTGQANWDETVVVCVPV